MNKKGQAIVEFIIILPLCLILIMAIIDVGKITCQKISLESTLNDVVSLYKDGTNIEEIDSKLRLDSDNINLNIEEKQTEVTLKLTKEVDIITPGLNLILDSPYEVAVDKNIYK